MEKKVNRNNVDPVLVDVKYPGFSPQRYAKKGAVNLARGVHLPRKKMRFPRRVMARVGVVFAAVFLIFGGFAVWGVVGAKSALGRGDAIARNFEGALKAFQEFDFETADGYLTRNEKELNALSAFFGGSQRSFLAGAFGTVVPAVGEGQALLGDVISLNYNLLRISRTVSDLKKNGFRYFRSDGEKLLSNLRELRERLSSVTEEVQAVKQSTNRLKSILPFLESVDRMLGNSYMAYSAQLYESDQLLEHLIAFLGEPGDRHLLLFFQNPAEIRPGGGFIGSYADVVLRGGQMISMDVRDIYDPDGQLKVKLTPPQPLQTMTQDWGARDANWFFDFPTSAATVITMMERSLMYTELGVTFEGAIGLNINVFRTIVAAVGPIPLPEYELTINQDNFLEVIQREVETGEDKAAGYPKRILTVLAPMLLERLENLSSSQLEALYAALEGHVEDKDIMCYAKDSTFAQTLASLGMDGAVYGLTPDFWGSYLAVVNANVAGGKSDAFVEESIEARVDVAADGSTLTDLSVTRAHHGDEEKDSWWRATNKDYLQILVNPGTELLKVKGNTVKNLVSDFDYDANGYQKLPQLHAVEMAKKFVTKWNAWVSQAFGKTVFAAWSYVPAGQEKTVEFRYQTASQEGAVKEGNVFSFVFERQSGVKSPLHAVIAAPVGYVWTESGNSSYTYESENPEKRVIMKLTLARQP